MPEVMTKAHLKVQTPCLVRADWLINEGPEKPRQWKRKVKGPSGKESDVVFLRAMPGATLDPSKIPADVQKKMLDKDFPAAIRIEDEIPPSPGKTVVGVSAAEAGGESIRRVSTKPKQKTPAKGRRSK